jgi:dolichyl-phosphate beta-glucosyltransferase
MNKPYLSVVIPCYNEENNLKRGVLDEVKKYLKKQLYPWEVIISDDGSTDKILDFLEKYCQKNPNFILLKNPHGGKPFAVRAGIKKASGKIVLFTDMDQSTPIKEVEKLLPFFEKNYDVVIGSRGLERKGFSLFRRLASRVFRLFRKALLLKEINDTQCGFKAFKNRVAKDLFSQLLIFKNPAKIKGWRVGAFDVELLFIAQKRGYKIAEVSVEWKDKDIARGKQRKFLKESWMMLKEILRVKINDLKGLYD